MDAIKYIINYLLDENFYDDQLIQYCQEEEINEKYKLVIINSGFFSEEVYGTQKSIPELPLLNYFGMPVLFGEDRIDYRANQIVIYADFIASTFFLISRYEEIVKKDIRDEHGRFPGKESIPYCAGFIESPIIQQYSEFICSCIDKLGVERTQKRSNDITVYLTHDVDIPWTHYTGVKAIRRIGGILRREHKLKLYPLLNICGIPLFDPIYTFKDMMKIDKAIKDSKKVYFIKCCDASIKEDGFDYSSTFGCKSLIKYLKKNNAIIGYHASYKAGKNPEQYLAEVKKLSNYIKREITWNRNHYLASREPCDFHFLINAGITDDYTMGYADIAGFRLGTCKPVRWIDPYSKEVTNLVLHPLTIMECTLMSPKYMNLGIEESIQYAISLIEQVIIYNGDVVLLWHNQSYSEDSPYKKIYETLLNYLKNQDKNVK